MAPRGPRSLPILQQTRLVAACIPAPYLYSNAASPAAMPPLQPFPGPQDPATSSKPPPTAARAALQRHWAPQRDKLVAPASQHRPCIAIQHPNRLYPGYAAFAFPLVTNSRKCNSQAGTPE